jgi:hypothetical protein
MCFWQFFGSVDILVRVRMQDPYLCLTDPDADPGGPKTDGSGCGIGTLLKRKFKTVEIKATIFA